MRLASDLGYIGYIIDIELVCVVVLLCIVELFQINTEFIYSFHSIEFHYSYLAFVRLGRLRKKCYHCDICIRICTMYVRHACVMCIGVTNIITKPYKTTVTRIICPLSMAENQRL